MSSSFQNLARSVVKRLRSFKHFTKNLQFAHLDKQSTINFKSVKKYLFLSSAVASFFVYWNYRELAFCQEVCVPLDKGQLEVHRNYDTAISKSRDILLRLKDEVGAPGIVIGVSIDGKNIWKEAFGYSDVENRVKCTPDTVMRIASISKSITMAAVAKSWEENKLDLDKPVQFYVPDFPVKKFNGEQVEITCRQLLSHLSGIRHYQKNVTLNSKEEKPASYGTENKKKQLTQKQENESVKEFDMKEYYIKDKYDEIKSALNIFQNDDLVCKPGTKFHYSTHAWTLVSAIVEKVANEPFTIHMTKLFKSLGMLHTYLDVNDVLIYHRSHYYRKNKQGHLVNAPYVDNSYKWAGGGFLSTVGDLLLFGNAMLYSLQYQQDAIHHEKENSVKVSAVNDTTKHIALDNKGLYKTHSFNMSTIEKHPGFLKPNTVKTIWTPVTVASKEWMYAMGWSVLPEKQVCEYCLLQSFTVAHTGGAVGASSVLLILPKECGNQDPLNCQWLTPPQGVIVTILTNLQDVNLGKIALEIAEIFHKSAK